MLRIIFASSFILLFILSIHAQEKTDREKNNLYGYVKLIEEKTYLIEFRDGKPIQGKLDYQSTEQFNIKGNIVYFSDEFGDEKIIYDKKGRIKEKTRKKFVDLVPKKVYSYNLQDQVVEENGFDAKGNFLGKLTFQYDSNGNLIKRTSEGNQKYYSSYITKNKYNQHNQLTETATYRPVNNVLKPEDFRMGYYKQVFVYNNSGQITIYKQIGVNENLYKMSVNRHDDKGNEIETIYYDSNGNLIDKAKYEYIYDEKGNYIKEIDYEWVIDKKSSFYKQSEVTYRKTTYFSDKEIKKFKEEVNK